MEQLIIKLLKKLLPGLIEGLHTPKIGIVTRIPNPPSEGVLSTDEEPYYAVDVQLLDHDLKPEGPIYESVPLPLTSIGHGRGQFGFPIKGARVKVSFAYGSPLHPYIDNIYTQGMHLPELKPLETLMQHSSGTYMRSTAEENWDLMARNKVRVGNKDVDLVKEVRRLAGILKSHTHPNVSTPTQASSIADVENKVKKIET